MASVIDEAEGLLFTTSPVLNDLLIQSLHYLFEFFEIDVFIDLDFSQVGPEFFESLLGVYSVIINIRDVLETTPSF